MNKNYNYKRDKLHLPEYGRHIQGMVSSLSDIADRDERTKQAHAVIAVMGNLNPMLRDTADYTHKLWNHLFIMSDFQLDVDSPYPKQSRQELHIVPAKMSYSKQRIRYKHYGRYLPAIIKELASKDDLQSVAMTVDNLARFMRTKSFEFNQEHPNNEVIIKDMKNMSDGGIEIDENAINNIRSDYKQYQTVRTSKSPSRPQQRPPQKNRAQHPVRNFTKNSSHQHNSSK